MPKDTHVTNRKRRNRLPVSCFGCRRRRERCDRNHKDGCYNCLRRNESCDWSGTSQDQKANIHTEVHRRTGRWPSSSAKNIDDVHLLNSIINSLPPKSSSQLLVQRYLELTNVVYCVLDEETFEQLSCSMWQDLEDLGSSNFPRAMIDFIGCYAIVLAATIHVAPASFLISNGTANSDENADILCDFLLTCFLELLDLRQGQGTLSIHMLQAIAIIQFTLSDNLPMSKRIAILDVGLRQGYQLGLDRLSSDEKDQETWCNVDLCNDEKLDEDLCWGASRFLAQDAKSREIGRAVWYALIFADFSTTVSQIGWQPTSFIDTRPPSGRFNLNFRLWITIAELISILRAWNRECAQRAAQGQMPKYAYALSIELRLGEILARQDDNLMLSKIRDLARPEALSLIQREWISFMIVSHLAKIHRPYVNVRSDDDATERSVKMAVYWAKRSIEHLRQLEEFLGAEITQIDFSKKALHLASSTVTLDFL